MLVGAFESLQGKFSFFIVKWNMKVQTLLNSRILSFHKVVLKNRNKVCFRLFISFFTGNSSALLLHWAPPTAGGPLMICTLLL